MRRTTAPSPWVVTAIVLVGTFAVGINFTILAVSRPAIAADLRIDPSTLVWLISGPILANALVTTLAGKLSDRFGHRRCYLGSMTCVLAFTVVSAMSMSAGVLIVSRIVGAIAGAGVGPASMAFVSLVHEPARRSRALGFTSLVGAGGPVIGLIVGGPLVDALGWRSIFWLQVPLLMMALALGVVVLPTTKRHDQTSLDLLGNLALALSVVSLMFAVERLRVWGLANPWIVVCGVVCVGAFAWFVVIELHSETPLVPLRYFKRRGFVAPNAALLFAQFGYMGGFILAPKLLIDVNQVSTTRVSQMLIPRPLAFAVAGVLAGYAVNRMGSRRIVAGGIAAIVASMVMIGLRVESLTNGYVMTAIALAGVGMGAAQPTFGSTIVNSVDNRDLGVAAATQQMVAQIATALGMNLMDMIQASAVPALGVAGSYSRSYLVGAGCTALGFIPAMMMPRRNVVRAHRRDTGGREPASDSR